MEDQDRKKILENLPRLVGGISSFDNLFEKLKSKRMFNSYMENEILSKEDNKKLGFLYWYVTTRGPDAFTHLCEALRETNHNDLAELLSRRPARTVRPFQNGNSSNEPSLEEEFPYEIEWTVIQSDPVRDVFDYDINKVYRMRSSPRGLALVINIRTYINNTMDERLGSEKDVARLRSVLPQLGYDVAVEEDLTADEIRVKVYEFGQDERHHDCDSAMLVVMGHGKETHERSKTLQIAGIDTNTVNSQELVDMLSARLCAALRGKPKIFFFQTCRGDNFNFPVKVPNGNAVREESIVGVELKNGNMEGRNSDISLLTDGVKMGRTDVVRSDSDIFIGYATSPGMLSMRDPQTGSWYIQTLCRVFAKHAWHEDLHSLLQTVKQERDRIGYKYILPIEETNQGFNKTLFFQPGIFVESTPIKLLNGS